VPRFALVLDTALAARAARSHAQTGLLLLMASRAAFFAAQNASKSYFEKQNWAVIGDVLNPAKPASTVVATLQNDGKTVHLINPRDKTGQCFASVSDVKHPIDVVDLCINHVEGLKQVEQMAALGIGKVFIQPGAESADILQLCKEKEIEVFQGCVMVELGAPH
jgi:predicted CoA-binding protein